MTTLKSQSRIITLQDDVKIYNINDKLVGLEMSIQTNIELEECFDFTKNYDKNIHIVIPLKNYTQLGDIIEKRVNKNTGIINFYSYAGGKPVSQLINGQRNLSKITYPPYSSTLLSSIKIPKVINGEILYILIDSYSEFLSISQSSLKTELIKNDTNLLIQRLINSIEGANDIEIKFIIDHDVFESINLVYPEFQNTISNIKNFKVHFTILNDKMNNYLCDDVFGKVIGGQQQLFNGTLVFKDYTILDVYNDSKINISIRGSGLYLLGNGISKIFVILEKESDEQIINITESTSSIVLFEENLINIKEIHPYIDVITEIITILNHSNKIKSCVTYKDKKKMKEFMLENSKYNTEVELYEFEDIISDEKEWYYDNLKLRILELINNSRAMLINIRRNFVTNIERSFQPNIPIHREYTCSLKNESINEVSLFTDSIMIPPPPVLRRH